MCVDVRAKELMPLHRNVCVVRARCWHEKWPSPAPSLTRLRVCLPIGAPTVPTVPGTLARDTAVPGDGTTVPVPGTRGVWGVCDHTMPRGHPTHELMPQTLNRLRLILRLVHTRATMDLDASRSV
jgi:hypothetical protein